MNKVQELVKNIQEKNYVKADTVLAKIMKEKIDIKLSSVENINKNK